MKSPETYAEWSHCLEVLRGGLNDEVVLSAMEKGALSWSSGVAERFSMQLFESINHRLGAASKRLQRNLDMARGNETAIVAGVTSMRRELKFLLRLTALPAIPADKRSYFYQQVVESAQRFQQSLENSAKSDRSGRLESLFKNNRVDNVQ